jgi:heme-degrading monooxygenase HmoA
MRYVGSVSSSERRRSSMHARTGSLQVSPDRVDDLVAVFEREQVPRFREQDGYKGFTMLVNRQSGRALGVSFWESEDARRASEELGAEARQAARETGGGEGEIVREEWEVVLDDMA